jgi:hypothetical protein
MKRFYLLMAGLAALVFATPAVAQMPGQLCSATGATDANCGLGGAGTNGIYRVTDGLLTTGACTGGTDEGICFCEGATCVLVADDGGIGSLGDCITLNGNADALCNDDADSQFTFSIDEDATVVITVEDSTDANTPLTIQPAGTGDITLQNDGAGTTLIGSSAGNTTQINAYSDSDYNFINTSSNSVAIHLRDYGDTTDDDMAHVSLTGNCTTATSAAEDCDFQINTVEAGVVSSPRLLIDGDGDSIFSPEPPDGGNGNNLTNNQQRRINGIPKIAGFSLGTGNDGSETVTTDFMDETPAGEWTATANVTDATEATVIKMGVGSLSLTYTAAVVAGNGADNPLGSGDQDWTDDESVGLWHRCDFTYDAGDLVLGITDNASEDVTTTFPAYGTADTWVWTELEVGSIANGDKDVITDIALDVSAAGAITIAAAAGGVCYFDYMYKWDAAEELAMGMDIYEDGILSMFSVITAGAAITPILEVEGTDWLAHYETGNDFIVPISDLSNDSLWGMAALE